jgi:hypothetical protein
MGQGYLFLASKVSRIVIELARPKLFAIDCTLTCKVQVDCPVETLDSILDEKGHLDVLVLEKFVKLLFHDLVVVCTEGLG